MATENHSKVQNKIINELVQPTKHSNTTVNWDFCNGIFRSNAFSAIQSATVATPQKDSH